MVRSNKFQMYDYGDAKKNTEHYGQVRFTPFKEHQTSKQLSILVKSITNMREKTKRDPSLFQAFK